MFSKIFSINENKGELCFTKFFAKHKKKMGDKKRVKYENINTPASADV